MVVNISWLGMINPRGSIPTCIDAGIMILTSDITTIEYNSIAFASQKDNL